MRSCNQGVSPTVTSAMVHWHWQEASALIIQTLRRLLECPQDFAVDFPQSERSEREKERKQEAWELFFLIPSNCIFKTSMQFWLQLRSYGNFIVLGLNPTRLSPLQTSSYPYFCPFNYYKCRSLLEWLIELRKVFYLQLLFYYKGSNSGITK